MAWDPLWRQVHMTCEPNLGGQVLGLQWDSLITMRGRARRVSYRDTETYVQVRNDLARRISDPCPEVAAMTEARMISLFTLLVRLPARASALDFILTSWRLRWSMRSGGEYSDGTARQDP
jgi:hypothetical protein